MSDASELKQPAAPTVAAMSALVFCSGCAALLFQVAWMRELRLVFGATTAANAAVLAIFMAGLGLGSALLGGYVERSANPLRLYGVFEAAIGLSTALTPWLIDAASAAYVGLGGQAALGTAGAAAVRLGLSALVMGVPTFLMGGTLPAAVRAVTRRTDLNRRALGALYGSNTLGAVCGSGLTTFYALEHLGVRLTLWLGCVANVMIGLGAIAWSQRVAKGDAEDAPPGDAPRPLVDVGGAQSEATPAGRRVLYLTAAALGFSFFALEMVWYRMLSPILGGTAFTFGMILCVALAGIGAGGWAYHDLFRRLRPTWTALAVTCAAEAALAILPYALGDRIALLAVSRRAAATTFYDLLWGWGYVSAIVVFPAAFVSGLQFPLLIALLGQGRAGVSRHIGVTYAWNTAGSILGSLVGGFGGMPLLGATGMWRLIALILAGLSLLLLAARPTPIAVASARHTRRSGAVAALVMSLATLGGALATGPTSFWRHTGIGVGRVINPRAAGPNVTRQWMNEQRQTIVWEADGLESSLAINAVSGLGFVVNGKSDGNALNDAPTQAGIAIMPTLLHPGIERAMVIGLGTGETAGWLAALNEQAEVDVVELEPRLDEMARRCAELNFNVLEHPRVHRFYNDGREFLLTTDRQYDAIVSEPSNPYRAGIASLYTTEFYQAVKKRLRPGGVFIQWLQAYDVDEYTINTVLTTVGAEFPHVEVWQTLPSDLHLICSTEPRRVTVAELQRRISQPALGDALHSIWKADDLAGTLAHFFAGPGWATDVREHAGLPRNTDDRTLLEFRFAKTVGRGTKCSLEEIRQRLAEQGHHRLEFSASDPRHGADDPPPAVDWDAVELRRQEFNWLFDGELSPALLAEPADQAIVESLQAYRQSKFDDALRSWPASRGNPASPGLQMALGRALAENGLAEALPLALAVEDRYPAEAAAIRATYHWRADQVPAATEALAGLFRQFAADSRAIPNVVEAALSRAIDVGKTDRQAAAQLAPLVAKPWASYRFDYSRKLVRLVLAEQLGTDALIAALAELEPHMRWTEAVLKSRAQAYASAGNPLATRAEREWQEFLRAEGR